VRQYRRYTFRLPLLTGVYATMARFQIFIVVAALIAAALAALYHIYTTGKVIARYPAQEAGEETFNVLFIAGRDSHADGEHEHKAGVQLLDAELRKHYPSAATTIVYGGWPSDSAILQNIDALVMYCDGGPLHPVNRNVDAFRALLNAQVGVVALHYCVEVPKSSDSASAMLAAIGGYFETDWSVNPHWAAQFHTLPAHEITTRASPFTLLDEWYFNMRFVANLHRIEPILRAIPPPETMSRDDGPHSGNPQVRQLVAAEIPQVTAWAFERPDGGRGFGYTGAHFHANWNNENALNIVIDAIAWAARQPTLGKGATERDN